MFPHIVHQIGAHISGLGLGARLHHLLKLLVILQGAHLETGILVLQVFAEHILPFPVNPLVQGTQIQHKIKHIVAGDNPAQFGNGLQGLKITQLTIGFKEIAAVIQGVPLQLQGLPDHVQCRGLTGAVASVENCHRLKVQHPQLPPGKDLKRIIRIVTGALFAPEKIGFLFPGGKCKMR